MTLFKSCVYFYKKDLKRYIITISIIIGASLFKNYYKITKKLLKNLLLKNYYKNRPKCVYIKINQTI